MRIILTLALLLASIPLFAANQFNPANKATSASLFTLNKQKLALLNAAAQNTKQQVRQDEIKLSALKAALFSAVVPGAGQAYQKSYWKAALFTGLEIAFWTANIVYNKKGKDEDGRMKAFGNTHWSEQRYWTKVYTEADAQGLWNSADPQVTIGSDGLIVLTPDVLQTLRSKQSEVGYTHNLPTTKTQQYYEMIYKYLHQFGSGWDDAPSMDYYDNAANLGNLTSHISTYRSMRDRSNGYYDTATNMVILIMVNHLASAFEAGWSAKKSQRRVSCSLGAERRLVGMEYINTYGVNIVW